MKVQYRCELRRSGARFAALWRGSLDLGVALTSKAFLTRFFRSWAGRGICHRLPCARPPIKLYNRLAPRELQVSLMWLAAASCRLNGLGLQRAETSIWRLQSRYRSLIIDVRPVILSSHESFRAHTAARGRAGTLGRRAPC